MMRDRIVETARSYVGTPFLHQGRTKVGLDCVGLVIRVAQDLGLSNFDYSNYSRDPQAKEFKQVLNSCKDIETKKVEDAAPGDILIFALPRYPCHTGIYTGRNVIHALSVVGKVVEHRMDSNWWSKVKGCYEFKGVEEWRK